MQFPSFTPRSRSGFQVAISKFQVSHQDPGQGFKLQFPSFKFHSKIQVRVSSCNFQVSSFKPSSRSEFQVAISKFQVSNLDPSQGFKLQFPSFKFQTNLQYFSEKSEFYLHGSCVLERMRSLCVFGGGCAYTPCVLWGWLRTPRVSCVGLAAVGYPCVLRGCCRVYRTEDAPPRA